MFDYCRNCSSKAHQVCFGDSPTQSLYIIQECHFLGISLISEKSEVPFQGISHLFNENVM